MCLSRASAPWRKRIGARACFCPAKGLFAAALDLEDLLGSPDAGTGAVKASSWHAAGAGCLQAGDGAAATDAFGFEAAQEEKPVPMGTEGRAALRAPAHANSVLASGCCPGQALVGP